MLCGFGDFRREWGDAERKNNNETDYSCKQLLKDSYLTFNDLEGQHTLISLWFQRQVTENRKGILGCPQHS